MKSQNAKFKRKKAKLLARLTEVKNYCKGAYSNVPANRSISIG